MSETGPNEINDFWENLPEGVEVVGRIYRITTALESVGRPGREFIGKVFEKVEEEYIATNYGPGRYNIHYRTKWNGKTYEKDTTYNIGNEFAQVAKQAAQAAQETPKPAQAPALDLGSILGGLTVEKVTAIATAVKMLKEFLAPPPPPPQVDLTKLIEIIAANNRPQSVSDAVMIQAMQSMQKANTPPSLLQQMRELKEIKETLKDDDAGEGNDGEGGTMNFLLEQAFKYLPSLLAAKQNNFAAVGQQVKENPMIAGLIANNPDLAAQFIEKAAQTYGVENAQQLAAGFGYNFAPAQAQAAQQPGAPQEKTEA